MEHLVIIFMKKGADSHDYYPTEEAAKAAVRKIAEDAHVGTGTVVTPSGRVSFDASNFSSAVYKGGGYES
jgi:hypothetical protein